MEEVLTPTERGACFKMLSYVFGENKLTARVLGGGRRGRSDELPFYPFPGFFPSPPWNCILYFFFSRPTP